MKRSALRLFTVLATISLVGIVLIQIFWVQKAFDLKEKQLGQGINIALKNVAEKILMYNNNPSTLVNPVEQISSNYFVVMVNDVIDAKILELYLKTEFEYMNIYIEFEYGIYDCMTQQIIYGNRVRSGKDEQVVSATIKPTVLPVLNRDNYYFVIYFPTRGEYLLGQMDIWIFSSLVLLIVVIFFSYTIFIIFKQKRLSEIQTDFINNMTHEFKTPISTISVSSEVLMKPNIIENPERLLNYATIIHNENKRLKKQVEHILQMATLEKEDLTLHKEAVDIHELIQRAIKNMEVTLKQVEGAVFLHFDPKPVVIYADALHLINIIYNLLDNAIKYSREAPRITISTENKKNGIHIIVEDEGIGIAPEAKKQIFNKFYRVPKGDIHDVKGYGLGLNYVKIMVEAHKGNIKVESEEGKGSKFILYLPYS